MHPLAVREGPGVPGAVGVVGLRVPGVATADVAPFAGVRGARAVEAGYMVVRARLVLMVGATAEIEIDVAGHRADTGRVRRIDVVAAHAVARVVVALEPPPGIHPPVPAVDRQGAGAGLALRERLPPELGGGRSRLAPTTAELAY